MLLLVILTSLCLIPIQEAAMHPYGDIRGYDRHINVFDTQGELMQVRYAEEASERGETIVCLTAHENSKLDQDHGPNHVVLGISSKAEDVLLDRPGIDKVSKVDDNIWVACAGLAGDGRALLRIARMICANFRTRYGTPPTLRYLANAIGEMQHEFTLSGRERPYGVSLMFIGYDEASLTPQIYVSKVDGSVSSWRAASLGKHSASCMEYLTRTLAGNVEQYAPSLEKATEIVTEALKLPRYRGEVAESDVGVVTRDIQERQPCEIFVFHRQTLDGPADLKVHSLPSF